jgi:hypothetical protein
VAFAGRIRDDPLFLFPNHAAFPDAHFSCSDSLDVAVAGVHSRQQKTEQSSQPFSVHRMYWVNRSNMVPVVFLSMSLVSEVNDAYQRLKNPETLRKIDAWLDPTNSPIVRRIQTWLPGSFHVESLQLGAQAQRLGIALLGVATAFAAGIVNFIVDYFIMVAALFFLLRDSDYFAERARAISPLSDEQESMFVERFRTVARATVLGNLATTLTQGTVSAFTFFFLGLPNPSCGDCSLHCYH